MARTFRIGDHVSWNSEAGRVSGRIIAIHTKDFDYKGYVHHASESEPQYEIKSDRTDHVAAHKGDALAQAGQRQSVKLPFFTIGHSNRSLEDFVELLGSAEIGLVADVRRIPRSRANPQFNQDVLGGSLARFGISCEAMAALGGRRGVLKSVSPDVNGLWRNLSFHNYADYALSAEFGAGLHHLLERGREQRCSIMCSEAVWWRCHRRIVADYLIASGETVFHIMGRGRFEPAELTRGAEIRPDGKVVYPWNLTAEC